MQEISETERILFDEAVARTDPAEREAFLLKACPDIDLRRRVKSLLDAHDEAGNFMRATGNDFLPKSLYQADPEELGTVIDRYKLLEKLGEGGFGTVWAAEQREPVKRRVALKIIKLGMDTRQVVARFEAERQALALMDHPNIAKVFDAGATEAGRPYFVMELVRGIPITEYCDQERLSTRDRLDLFMKVCHAIQHAHQKGIIHRDIKPSNILVTLHDGVPVPKVIDFGVAKAIQQELTEKTIYTQMQQFIGTPAYMSPEQAEMSGLDIDTRSDIYSLGVLLYELLTGVTPFDAKELMRSGLDQMRKIIREREPLTPSSRLSKDTKAQNSVSEHSAFPGTPRVPHSAFDRDLDWIVMKCLEKDRTRRYETASALAADLKRHLENEPVTARPPSAAYRLQKAWRRNKLVYTAGFAVLLALAVGLTVAAFGWLEALRATEETRRRAYATEISAAFQALSENNLARAIDLLERQRPKPGEEDLRGFEWRHLWQLCQSDVKDTVPDAGEHPVFSPNGRWLAYGGKRIVIRELPSLAVVQTIPTAATTLVFSPDGKLLAGGHDSHVRLWSTESWEEVQSLPDARYPAVFSPDSRWLVTGAAGGYRVWNHPESTQGVPGRTWQPKGFCPHDLERHQYLFQSEHGVAFSPDGRLLVTAGHPDGYPAGQFQVWDFPALTRRPNFSPQLFELASAVFTPDGKHLLIGDQIGRLMVWDAAEGRLVETPEEHTGGITAITFARDGRTMATSSRDGTLVVWDWLARKVLVRLRGHRAQIWSSAISPDGKILASASLEGTIRLWDATTSHERPTISECALITGFSADSRLLVVRGNKNFSLWRLADDTVTPVPLANHVFRGAYGWADVHGIEPYAVFGRFNGVLEHWDLATMSPIASWPAHQGEVSTAVFSPDGQLIATSGTKGDVKLWDPKTHREVGKKFEAQGKKLRCLVFSPNGRLLAGSEGPYNDPQVYIWDVNDGKLLHKLDGYTGLGATLAFSPDGELLATPHSDNNARLWEIPSGNLKATLKGHTNLVTCVAFSPDGKTLATGSYERKIKLWNIATQQEVATLEPLPGSCLSLRFSPDGRTLAAGSWMGTEPYTSLLQAPSFEEIAALEAKEKTQSNQP
jgi:WD40 repeat protein/serine/threonine protein kinase